MNCSFLKAAAVAVAVAVLTATAGAASYVSAAPLPVGFLSSPRFLWIAANVIVVWLVSSYRHHRTAGAAASSASHADDVSAAMDSLYLSSEHDVFAAPVAPDEVVAPVLKRQPREAKTSRRTDRPRVRRKSGSEEEPRAVAAEAKPYGKKKPEEKPRATAAEAKPDSKAKPAGEEEEPRAAAAEPTPGGSDDVSMESAWQSILQRGAARPVAVQRKSETWGSEELPQMQRAADKAIARREMRKSASMVPPSPPHPAAAAPTAAKQGWRTRDVLVMAQDELLRRAESFIRRQHEHLRLQRQESEQRQAVEHQSHHRPAPIRV